MGVKNKADIVLICAMYEENDKNKVHVQWVFLYHPVDQKIKPNFLYVPPYKEWKDAENFLLQNQMSQENIDLTKNILQILIVIK